MKRFRLHRRALLRGAGASLALPWLEAMLPMRSALAQSGIPKRFVAIYFPNGQPAVDWDNGGQRTSSFWHPAATGSTYDLRPLTSDLQSHKADITMVGNVNLVNSGNSEHPGHCSAFLSGELPPDSLAPFDAARTADQIIADDIGPATRLRCLVLSPQGNAENFNSQSGVYASSMSWVDPTTPVPRDTIPTQIFDKIVGGASTGTMPSTERNARKMIILDFVRSDAQRLKQKLGKQDQRTLDQYLTNVREVETRLQASTSGGTCAGGTAPDDGLGYAADLRVKFDLLALALQCDATRVATFVLDWEGGDRSYSFLPETSGALHGTSHEDNRSETENYMRMVRFQIQNFSYFLDLLKASPEGAGTMLDHSMVLFGSGIGNVPSLHNKRNLPLVLAGRGGGTLSPGRSVRMPNDTTVKTLSLTLMQKMGVTISDFHGETKTTDLL